MSGKFRCHSKSKREPSIYILFSAIVALVYGLTLSLVPNLARRNGQNQALTSAQAVLEVMSFILYCENTRAAASWYSRNKAYVSTQKGLFSGTCAAYEGHSISLFKPVPGPSVLSGPSRSRT